MRRYGQVALDKKLVMKFRDLVQSKQLEAAYDTSILALQIPATPRFMAKVGQYTMRGGSSFAKVDPALLVVEFRACLRSVSYV